MPKLIARAWIVGTRFPAARISQGEVLLAWKDRDEGEEILALPTRSGLTPEPAVEVFAQQLAQVREQGYAYADEELAPGIRSVAVPVRDGDGAVRAAMNVTVHAAETSGDVVLGEHLPRLLEAAERVSRDWAAWWTRPIVGMV